MSNAVIYARVSTASQDEKGTSLESQIRECQNYAVQNGYTVKDTFSEIYSGAYLFERPVLNQIRQDIRHKKYDAIIAYAIDRISRDVAHLIILSNECERYNVELKFVSEDLDNSAEGKLLQSVKGYVAEIERQKIRERSLRGKYSKAQSGKLSFGHKLYGYIVQDKRRVIFEPEAEIIRWLYDQVIAGESIRSLTVELDLKGYPPPGRGKCWAHSTVRRILRNPAYAGQTYAFRYKRVSFKRDGRTMSYNVERERSGWIAQDESATPAIISLDAFNRAGEILDSNKSKKRKGARVEALLRGRMICGVCGRSMTVNSDSSGWRGYTCDSRRSPLIKCGNRGVSARFLDEIVWSEIVARLQTPGKFDKSLAKKKPLLRDNLSPLKKSIDRLESEISRIISRAGNADDNLWDLLAAEITRKQSELSAVKDLYEDEMRRTSQANDTRRYAKDLRASLAKILPKLASLDFEGRVKVVNALQVSVVWIRELELSQIILGTLDN